MELNLNLGSTLTFKTDCLVIGVFEDLNHSPIANELNSESLSWLKKAIQRSAFAGKVGDALMLYDPLHFTAERLLLVGMGNNQSLSLSDFGKMISLAMAKLIKEPIKDASFAPLPAVQLYLLASRLIEEECYRFVPQPAKQAALPAAPTLAKVTFCVSNEATDSATKTKLTQVIRRGQAMGRGSSLARQLGDLPANVCTPSYLADQAQQLCAPDVPLKVQVHDDAAIRQLGFGAMLSVTQGSREPARFIELHYNGGDPTKAPTVLIGKGITFDSGGISLKPAATMDEMKYDMCGAASVLGVFQALVELRSPVNVIGLIPACENLPDGQATKPGDIVTSLSGQTIEIINTDAEGRLLLCDALTYAERFNPYAVIDIATLTGACVIALGRQAHGLLSNNAKLSAELVVAGDLVYDRAWALPLWEEYQNSLKSSFADMANVGGREAGTITAGCFLSRFAKAYPWAHLDVAGTAWNSGAKKGATGRPVALLVNYLLRKEPV